MKNNSIAQAKKTAAFTLLELMIVVAIIVVVFAVIVACGWGVAFTFSATVLVPWLGIPAAWANAGALVASIFLTSAGTVVVIVVLILLFLAIAGIVKACKGGRR